MMLASWASAADVKKNHLEQQRQMFQQARNALKANDMRTFKQRLHDLGSYPLVPYLEVWQGYAWIKQEKDAEVADILKTHAKLPETRHLRQAWVENLAQRGQWPQVSEQLALLPNAKGHIGNIVAMSYWYSGHTAKALRAFTQQWRQGVDLPEYETKLSQAWHASGHPNRDDIWARAMTWAKQGQWKKIKVLKRHLDVREQKWLMVWEQAQSSPEHALLISHEYDISPKVMGWIAKDGLPRLAHHDMQRAWAVLQRIWPQLKQKDAQKLQAYLAVQAAKQHQQLASVWLAALPAAAQTKKTRAWLVRSLLLQKQWRKALHAMQSMPETEQVQARWLYWQGYVLEQLKQTALAKPLFEQAALDRGYYSFLGAQHLGQPYQMGASPMRVVDTTALQKNKAIQRAYEWRYWGKTSQANAEWSLALKGASKQTWAQAMQLAMQWKWYEQVIRAARKSRQMNVLQARFPMAYASEVKKSARHNQLDASLIWGIIRQESAFNPQARSRKGARGLMQLMPGTARDVVRKHRLRHNGGLDLSHPKHNIQLGSLYVADMLKRFDGQNALAIAAYNAGPNRVAKWLKSMPMEQQDLWIEVIPFNETRRYVQYVLAFMAVYDWLQEQDFEPHAQFALTKAG